MEHKETMRNKLDLDTLTADLEKSSCTAATKSAPSLQSTSLSNHRHSVIQVTNLNNTFDIEHIFQQREYWLDRLATAGAILFRGFHMGQIAAVERFASHFMTSIFRENTEHTPLIGSNFVQQPVDYSSSSFLLWHNENSFNLNWPSKAIFACQTPASAGGETPVVDSRDVYQHLDNNVREEFESKGVRYCRRYHADSGIGLGWRTIFKTNSKSAIEAICAKEGLQYRWFSDDSLLTFADRPAVYQLSNTGEKCWINQAQHWHFSCLSHELQQALQKLCTSSDEYPRNCFFADGSRIPDSYMTHILEVYQSHQQSFPWQAGDILLVDNRLKAHARNPYQGERKVLVCFGDMESY